MNLQSYNKFWLALSAALAQVIVVLSDTVTPDVITKQEYISVAIAFVGAIAVYQVANK